MSKFLITTLSLGFLSLPNLSLAECIDNYRITLHDMEKSPLEYGFNHDANTEIGQAGPFAVAATFSISGSLIAATTGHPEALLTIPVLSSSAYAAYVIKHKAVASGYNLLKETKVGDGPLLQQTLNNLRSDFSNLSKNNLIKIILDLNNKNEFCQNEVKYDFDGSLLSAEGIEEVVRIRLINENYN